MALGKNLLADAVTPDGRSLREAMGMPASDRYALGRRISDAERAYAVREPEELDESSQANTFDPHEVAAERARLARQSPDALVNFTNRGKIIGLKSMTDEGLKTLWAKVVARQSGALTAAHYAENEHNRDVVESEVKRRLQPAEDPPRPYGSFNRFDAEAQAVAHEAANNPVHADQSWVNVPLSKKTIASPTLWKDATEWFKARASLGEAGKVAVPTMGGKRVGFTGAGKRKGLTKDPFAQALTPYVPLLLQNAKLVMREVGKRSDRFPSVTHLVARFQSPQGPRDVWMVVRRNNEGDWYYDHTHTQVRPLTKP